MSAALNPIVSDFSTQEEATSYDLWFRAKVQESLRKADDPATPRYSSDELSRRIKAIVEEGRARHAARRLA